MTQPRTLVVGSVHLKLVTLLDLCVSSLRRGHANLLCIVPILSDDLLTMPRTKTGKSFAPVVVHSHPIDQATSLVS